MATIEDRRETGRSKPWRVRYYDPEGNERSKSFAKWAEARSFSASVETDKDRGTYIDPRNGRIRFGEFAEEWLDNQTSDPSTREAVAMRVRVHILPTFSTKRLNAIKPSTIQSWLRGLQQHLAPGYVKVLLANLSAILNDAVADDLIPTNPCSSPSVRPPRIDQSKIIPWTRDQVDAVVSSHPARYSTLPFVTAGLGLRQGEVFGLDLDAVDWLRHRVHVRQQVKLIGGHLIFAPPKGGRDRYVPLPDVVGFALARHMETYEPTTVTLPWKDLDGPPRTSTLLFTSRESNPINRTYFNREIWKPALVKAGIAPTRSNGMHALRHYYASATLSGGVSIRALADYLGHHDPGYTLRIYAHLMPDDEDRARAVLEAALGSGGSHAAQMRPKGVQNG